MIKHKISPNMITLKFHMITSSHNSNEFSFS